jgi:HD-like signal output (HDOD) protein
LNLENRVRRKIKKYKPKGKLAETAIIFLETSAINHSSVKYHSMGTALLSEDVARIRKKDKKAAFFAGLLHDYGKIFLPKDLFDGHDITDEEYQEVKRHAMIGFWALENRHLFIAMCVGLHHALYDKGYGLTIRDFPNNLGAGTVEKVLKIAAIVSICDFINSFTTRTTKIKDGSDKISNNLEEMLMEKYPNDLGVVKDALFVLKKSNFQ